MKIVRQFVSLLLCVVMLMEFLPLDALAAGSIVSDSFIEAAWALSGQDPNAAHWHRGMEPEITWNAEQLDEWLDYVLSEPILSVQNAHHDLNRKLATLQESNPSAYNALTGGTNALHLDYMTSTSHSVEDLRQQLRAYRFLLVMNADKIANLIALLRDDSVSDRDKKRYSSQLESAVETIRETRAVIVGNGKDWLEQIEGWHGDFRGSANSNSGAVLQSKGVAGAPDDGLHDWIQAVMSEQEEPIRTSVKVPVNPDGRNTTLMAKLATGQSVLKGTDSDTQVVDVIPDTQFVVYLTTPAKANAAPTESPNPSAAPNPTPTPLPVEGGNVTVWDAREIKKPDMLRSSTESGPYSTAATSNEHGDATFDVSGFTLDDDGIMHLGIIVDAEGYQPAEYYVQEVMKGGVYTVSLTPQDGSVALAAENKGELASSNNIPFAFHADFNNNDVMGSKLLIYYSPENDVLCDISIGVWFPDGYSGSRDVTLKYYDITGVWKGKKSGEWKTMTVKADKAVLDDSMTWTRQKTGTYYLYTFEDQWKQILGPGKKIGFHIGDVSRDNPSDELDESLYQTIQLTVKRGNVDKPIYDSGTFAMTMVTNTFKNVGNLFSFTLPKSWPSILGGSTIALNLPMVQNLPKVSYDIDGSITIAVGIDPGNMEDHNAPSPSPGTTPAPEHWYDDHTWKSQTKRDLDKQAKDREDSTSWAAYKARLGATWDGIKQNRVNFLGSATISMGVFGMVTGQFSEKNKYSEDDDDPSDVDTSFSYNCRNLSLTVGVIGTFSAELAWQFSIVGYLSVNFDASLAFALTISGEWERFEPGKSSYGDITWGATSGLTILFKITISITLGVGVKGILSASISGYAYISIMIQWTFSSGSVPWVTISAGAGVRVTAQALFLKYTFDVWKMKETVIYDSKTGKQAFNILDVFMGRALAEEGDDAPEPMTPLEPEHYPALVPKATQVMDDVSMQNGCIKYADRDGTPFAFYIAQTEDGHDRLTWYNLETGTTGNLQDALATVADSGEDKCRVCDMIDYAFDVKTSAGVSASGGAKSILVSVLCTSKLVDETYEENGETVTIKAPTDSYVYYVILVTNLDDGLDMLYTWGTPDYPARHGFISQQMDFTCGEIDLAFYLLQFAFAYYVSIQCGIREYIPHSEDDGKNKGKVVNSYYNFGMPVDVIDYSAITASMSDDIPLLSGKTERYQCQSGHPAGESNGASTWYALESAGDGTSATLVHGVDAASGDDRLTAIREQDVDDDVIFYRRVQDAAYCQEDNTESVFFLARTTDDNGEHHWLKRAGVTTHAEKDAEDETKLLNCWTDSYDITDFDLEIMSNSFYTQEVNGVTYIYWLTTAQKDEETDPDIFRIMSVVYDPSTDTVTNEMVLAEFSFPEANQSPADIFLSNNGTGYCTVSVGDDSEIRSDVYSFPVNWVTSLDLNGMALMDTHANPASWLDTVVSVMNSGNTGIGTFDLELFLKADDGTETVVETLHCDCLDPSKSAIYLGEGASGTMVSNGDHTIVRDEDAVEPFQQPDHNLNRTGWKRGVGFTDPTEQRIDSPMILPGAVKAFMMPLYIPADWNGYKTLFLRVSSFATRANWIAANSTAGRKGALQSGKKNAALNTAQNPEIVYKRAADGTMVRADNAALMSGDGTVSLSPHYPETVKGSQPLALNHDIHDLNVTHRVYTDADGTEYIAISFMNHAHTGGKTDLEAKIYLDNNDQPLDLNLAFYPDKTTNSYTHTITLSMDALLGGQHPRNARVVILPKNTNVEETALRNNEFVLHFDDDDVNDPLRFLVQPSSTTALPGETVRFTVTVEGGVRPYTYLWQVWMDEKTGWKDIPDSNSPTLTVENVALAMHGRKARCIVTDHYLNTIVSNEAMLTVIGAGGGDLPETGDDTNLPLYIAVALLGLALLWWIRRREKNM